MRITMKKWTVLIVYCFFILNFLSFFSAFADDREHPDVKISVLSDKEIYEEEFVSEVQVIFYNQDLYHDGIFLSYHILQKDENGTIEILEFENQRVKVVLDESGTAGITLQIALNELKNGVYLEFDLVDVNNLFWFSYNEEIDFSSDVIEIFDRPIYKHIKQLEQAVRSETGVFAVNLMVFIGGIGIYIYVRRKKIFEW